MLKLEILGKDYKTYIFKFPSQEAIDAYLAQGDIGFGHPERQSINEETGETVTLPAEYTITITDVTSEHETNERIAAQVAAGKNARLCCSAVLDLITGYNLTRWLTQEQIDLMLITFAPINSALLSGRPNVAKALIGAVEADGVIITEQMKSDGLAIFNQYGF